MIPDIIHTAQKGKHIHKDKLTRSDARYMTFKDSLKQKDYELYRGQNTNVCVLIAITAIITIGNFVMSLMLVSATIHDQRTPIYTTIFRLTRAACVLPAWILIYCLSLGKQAGIHATIRSYLPSDVFLGNSYILCYFIGMCLLNIARVLAGDCTTTHYLHSKNCNPEASVNGLPQDTTIMCILGLVVLQMIVKSHQWWVIVVSWAMVTGSLFALVIHINSSMSSVLAILSALLIFVLYEYEKQTLDTFLALENLECTIREVLASENANIVMEMQTAEMRNLIGNVAHDLKTPMQAFMLELEHLENIIMRVYRQTTCDTVVMTRNEVSGCSDALQNLNDTCTFMYMLMNRAIDFTKSSAGFKLVPSLETVNFPMSIKWALNLIKTKYSNVTISLLPISADICSLIITDKQWLIENIICLVSNAAKFTLSGSVTVSCSLNKTNWRSTYLHVDVEDTGIGINPEMRHVLFKPFQQAMRMAGGTGLGLYSLSKRVDAIGGTYGVADRYDGASGTRFWFTMPYKPDDGDIPRGAIDGENNGVSNYMIYNTTKSYRFGGVESSQGDIELPDMENQLRVEPLLSPRRSSRIKPLLCSVLIIEDPMLERITEELISQGTQVERCTTLCDASATLSRKNFDVLLISEKLLNTVKEQSEQRDQDFWKNLTLVAVTQSVKSHCNLSDGVITSDATAGDLFSVFCSLRNSRKAIQTDSKFKSCCSACSDVTIPSIVTSQCSIDLGFDDVKVKHMTALVVDDSTPIQKSVKKLLENEGFLVEIAENGAIALDKLRCQKFTLVLMDLQMPVMDGLECVSRLRKHEEETSAKRQVIFGMTAYTQEDIKWSPREAGMDGLIAKPFRTAKLLEMCKMAGIVF